MYGKKVKLTADLRKYHPGLVEGAIGTTTAPVGMWAKGSDRFTSVEFGKGIGNWDILNKSLCAIEEIPDAND